MMRIAVALIMLAGVSHADPAILDAVNVERSTKGRVALVWNDQLAAAARAHALDMARKGYFSHTGASGSSVRDRVDSEGYRGCFWAENIAQGQKDVRAVMASWMGSRGHRQNILHRKARDIGVAKASQNTWVMVLAAPC